MAPKKCRTKLIKLTLWIALTMKKKLQKLWILKAIKTILTLRITSNLQGSTQVISIKETNETTAIVICWMGHRTLPLKRLPLSISKCLKAAWAIPAPRPCAWAARRLWERCPGRQTRARPCIGTQEACPVLQPGRGTPSERLTDTRGLRARALPGPAKHF